MVSFLKRQQSWRKKNMFNYLSCCFIGQRTEGGQGEMVGGKKKKKKYG